MRFYCFVASVIALTGLADAYNLAQTDARPEEAIFEDTLAETYVDQDGTAAADPAPAAGAAAGDGTAAAGDGTAAAGYDA